MKRLQIVDMALDLPVLSLFALYPYQMERSAKLQTTLVAMEQALSSP